MRHQNFPSRPCCSETQSFQARITAFHSFSVFSLISSSVNLSFPKATAYSRSPKWKASVSRFTNIMLVGNITKTIDNYASFMGESISFFQDLSTLWNILCSAYITFEGFVCCSYDCASEQLEFSSTLNVYRNIYSLKVSIYLNCVIIFLSPFYYILKYFNNCARKAPIVWLAGHSWHTQFYPKQWDGQPVGQKEYTTTWRP